LNHSDKTTNSCGTIHGKLQVEGSDNGFGFSVVVHDDVHPHVDLVSGSQLDDTPVIGEIQWFHHTVLRDRYYILQ
jgi:hypothetical protein